LVFQTGIYYWRSEQFTWFLITNNSKFSDIYNIMVISLSNFIDEFDTFMIYIFVHFYILSQNSKLPQICSNFISQRAVKAWIIANCFDFVIWVFEFMFFYHIEGFQVTNSSKPYDAFFLGHLYYIRLYARSAKYYYIRLYARSAEYYYIRL
jgi:hypothetical protein